MPPTRTLCQRRRLILDRPQSNDIRMNSYETNQTEHDEEPTGAAQPRRVRTIRRQPAKLAYSVPHATTIPRVVPVGYESPDPEKLPSTPMREARMMRRLSIRELSRRSGISPSTIYRIEQGKTGPRPHVARAISAVFECSPWEITEFRDVMAATSLPY
jgi:DNA-binding XRE family transcriptional regulator